MSIVTDIEILAELYRRKLNLRTWEEQAAFAATQRQSWYKKYEDPVFANQENRQTGRSTRDTLLVLATCSLLCVPTLVVTGVSVAHMQANVMRAKLLIEQLNLTDIKVINREVHDRPRVVYTDHYGGQQRVATIPPST